MSNVNARDELGRTPLHMLQGKGKGKKDAVVGYFINAGFLIVNFLFVSSYY